MYIQALTFGQAYQISLLLEMPESPTNQDLGMFMIKTTCFSQDGVHVASSVRSVSYTRSFLSVCPHVQIIKKCFVTTSCEHIMIHCLHSLLCVSQAQHLLSASSSRFVSTALMHNNLLIANLVRARLELLKLTAPLHCNRKWSQCSTHSDDRTNKWINTSDECWCGRNEWVKLF